MAPRELRATRYLNSGNDWLKDFITRKLPLFDFDTTIDFYRWAERRMDDTGRALLNANDRFYLLTGTLHRSDALHPWLFERCREVEADPDGHLDLWARYHYKSTIGTFAGIIQEIIVDPEITIAILSCKDDVARPFLTQIKQELEKNADLKRIHADVFWENPRLEAPKWSEKDGITVKRHGNPKECTVEAFGLIDGMPTGRHFQLLDYDDLVTEKLVGNPEMIQKVTIAWELSDNLGTSASTRKWHWGTRYCTIGSSRIAMGDWSHKPIADVRIGDTVVGWVLENGKRVLKPAKVVNRGIHFQQPVNTYTLENGRTVTCTDDHKWWRGPHGGGPEYAPLGLPAGKRADRKPQGHHARGRLVHLRQLLVPADRSDTREAAWLAGFFDGEGTIQKNKNHPSGSVCITQTMHNPALIDETRRVLRALDFEYREAWHTPKQENWNERCVFSVNGGWQERYRFLAEVAPVRREKLAATLFGQLMTDKVKLLSVDDAGDQDVHWLETETGNYVVEGFCSSNSFADTYGVLIDRGSIKERRYAATTDGTVKGAPVFLTQKKWDEVKTAQQSTVNAQMLLNPLAGTESTFRTRMLRHYDMIPSVLNVYILCDPSKGRGARSDRTAIAVIGIDAGGNKYLLDGVRHRMKLSERWSILKKLYRKWCDHPGVQMVRVGYEQYGMQSDLEVIEEYMQRENIYFEIEELNSSRDGSGKHSKNDRIERLEPDLNRGMFYIPAVVYHPDFGGGHQNSALWDVWSEENHRLAAEAGNLLNPAVDTIIYRAMQGPTRQQRYCEATLQTHRIVTALKRRDERSDMYDLTRSFVEEMRLHPFAPHDDLIDAVSRIYDMEPKAPVMYETVAAQPTIHPDS